MESSNALNMKQAQERLYYLQHLTESPGWALFVSTFSNVVQQARDAARKSETPHQMAMHFGAAESLQQALTWPAREHSMLRELLQMLAAQPVAE